MSEREQPLPEPGATEAYQPPRLTMLGTLGELTRGSPFPQTPDDGDLGSD